MLGLNLTSESTSSQSPLLSPSLSSAVGSSTAPSPTPMVQEASLAMLIDVLGGLAFVILLILGLAWLLKRLNGVNNKQLPMQLVSAMSVGTKEKIVVLEVEQKRYILGVTAASISVIDKLEVDKETAHFEEVLQQVKQSSAPTNK